MIHYGKREPESVNEESVFHEFFPASEMSLTR